MLRKISVLLPAVLLLALPVIAKDSEEKTKIKPAQPGNAQGIQLRAVPIGAGIAVGRTANPLQIIRNSAVQQELKLDEAQQAKVAEALQGVQEKNKQRFAALRGLQGDERQKQLAKLQKESQDAIADAQKAIRGTLKPEQSQRLDQIMLQQRGLQALGDEKIAKQLEIGEQQQQKIKAAAEEGRQQRVQLSQDLRNGNVPRQNYRAKLDEIAKSTERKTLEVLSKEQQAKFDKMKGETFEFPQPRFAPIAVPVQPGQPRKIQIQPGKIKLQIVPKQQQPKS